MKKYIFMAVAGMLSLSSCSNDDNDLNEQNTPRQMTFTAGFDNGATTRATLNGKSVSFDANDEIGILSANNTTAKKFTTTAGGATATFTGTAKDDTKFYAVYPYTDGLTLDGTTIKGVEISPEQPFAANFGWESESAIAYATTTNSTLTFHNACALLKITNDVGDNVDIVIDCSGGVLTGTFNLDTSSGKLTVQDGRDYLSVRAESVPNNKTIYLAIAPGVVEGLHACWQRPIPFEGYDEGNKNKSGSVTFEKGKIYDLGRTSAWNENQ